MSTRAVIVDLDKAETSSLLSLAVVMGSYPLCSITPINLCPSYAQGAMREAESL
jgi:hypothetical protein